jgi:hypothetical protein
MRRFKAFFVKSKLEAITLMRKARRSGNYAIYAKVHNKYIVKIFS